MDVESLTGRLAGRFGPRIAEWCAAVPELLAQLASRWGLALGGPLPDGASSVALRCRWPDGTPAVLKIGPERELLAEQAEMLGWFAPSGGVPAVLALDAEAGALVLEEVVPGTPVAELPGPDPGNVLVGGAGRGLVAIAPKACAGDPCFDAVDFVVAGAGREGVGTRCARLAAAYGLDPDRLYAWSRVNAAFAAVAHLGAGDEGPAAEELLALTR